MKGGRHGRGKSTSFLEVLDSQSRAMVIKEVYDGLFKNNQRHGRGTLHQSHLGTFKGRFLKGNLANEIGCFEDKHCRMTYEGDINNYKLTGQGTMTFKNSGKYVGQFLDGQLHGHAYVLDRKGNILIPISLFEHGKFVRMLLEGEQVNIW